MTTESDCCASQSSLPCGLLDLKSGHHQAWWQVPGSTELSCGSCCVIYNSRRVQA